MHIHILGICGTFMGGIAVIARQAGHTVTGCDANVYPPMSTQLEAQGIRLIEGWDPTQIDLKPDLFVIGNVVSRGNALMEAILDAGLPYVSGPQWLAETVLRDKWVLAVAGTHLRTGVTFCPARACRASWTTGPSRVSQWAKSGPAGSSKAAANISDNSGKDSGARAFMANLPGLG